MSFSNPFVKTDVISVNLYTPFSPLLFQGRSRVQEKCAACFPIHGSIFNQYGYTMVTGAAEQSI